MFTNILQPSNPAMDKSRLISALDNDREHHIAFLQALIQAPSPNPPGDTTLVAKVVTEYLDQQGVVTTTIAPKETLPNIVSDFIGGRGDGPRVVMNGHMDVFPVGDANDWKYSPWSGHIDDGHIYGRGSVDMKAGTAASIIAFSYLHKYRAELNGSLALTVVSDEETGGRWGSRWLLAQKHDNYKWRGDCMVNAEPGGIQSVRFGEKGTLRLTFTVNTVGAHGAYLHLSEGANRIGIRFVTELLSVEQLVPELPDSLAAYIGRPDVRRHIDEIMGKGAANNILRPTVNIGSWNGGVKVNMIPERCIIEADIRLPIGMKADIVMHHIHCILKRYPEISVSVQEAASNPASYSDFQHPMVSAIAKNSEAMTGHLPVTLPSLGATDCKFWRYLDIPTYVYGVSPNTMASKDEHVNIDEFLIVVKTHALAIWDYLGGPP